jgi:hypothetical protein
MVEQHDVADARHARLAEAIVFCEQKRLAVEALRGRDP